MLLLLHNKYDIRAAPCQMNALPAMLASMTTSDRTPRAARVGLISDTHGLLRAQAVAALQGCSQLLHMGDVGGPEILEQLAAIAPLVTVRGNNDRQPWSQSLPVTATVTVQNVKILAIHDIADLECDPRAEGIRVVVAGHSHKPSIQERDGVLFINPGSAGPRRFKLPIAVGELIIEGSAARARIIDL
jgi:putative phosphoesterase